MGLGMPSCQNVRSSWTLVLCCVEKATNAEPAGMKNPLPCFLAVPGRSNLPYQPEEEKREFLGN